MGRRVHPEDENLVRNEQVLASKQLLEGAAAGTC